MRILITGGAGFIGSNLIAVLFKEGHEITVLDSLSPQVHGADPEQSPLFNSVRDKVRFIRGCVTNRYDIETSVRGQDAIVHLAAETGTGQSMYMVEHYSAINIQATAMILNVLAEQRDKTVRRMVVASSRSIYGEGKYLTRNNESVYPEQRQVDQMKSGKFELYDSDGYPLKSVATDESSRIHPSSVYGITKQVQEQLVMNVCPNIGIEPVALRYQNVYGPGQSLLNPYTGILSIFSNLIMQNKEINVFEDGLESRDFVFIDDVIAATMLAIEHENAAGKVFNVGSGQATTVLTVVKHLCKHLGEGGGVRVSGEFRIGDIRHNFADLTHIASELNFKPKVSFDEGIQRFANWVGDLGPAKSSYEESLAEMRMRGLMKGQNI